MLWTNITATTSSRRTLHAVRPIHSIGKMALTSDFYNEVASEGVFHSFRVKNKVYTGKSEFQDVEIVDTDAFGRVLLLDKQMQSAALDEYAYHETLVQPAMLTHPNPKRVYIGGGGEGATAREILRHKSVEELVMADIDAEVCRVCKNEMKSWHQGAYDDPRMKLVTADAKATLEEYPDGYFDVIVLDLCDPLDYGPCYTLYATEFYDLCHRKLSPEGVLVTQAGPSSMHALADVFTPVCNTLRHSNFEHVYPYSVHLPSFAHTWGFCLAAKSPLESNSRLPAAKLSTVEPEVVDKVITERLGNQLRHYDGETHRHMFCLPKPYRTALQNEQRVICEATPIFMSHIKAEKPEC